MNLERLKFFLAQKRFYLFVLVIYLFAILSLGYLQSGNLLEYIPASPALDDEPDSESMVYEGQIEYEGEIISYYHQLSPAKPSCLVVIVRDPINPIVSIEPVRRLFQASQCDLIDIREIRKNSQFTYGYEESITLRYFIDQMLETTGFQQEQVTLIVEGAAASMAGLYALRMPNLKSLIFLDAVFSLDQLLAAELQKRRNISMPGLQTLAIFFTKLRGGFLGSDISFRSMLSNLKPPILLICGVENYKVKNICFQAKKQQFSNKEASLAVYQILDASSRNPADVRLDQQSIIFQFLSEEGLILQSYQ